MPDDAQQEPIDAIVDDAIRRIRSGEMVDTTEYLRLYPDLADEIQLLMPAILLLERPVARPVKSNVPLPFVPGYEVTNEIGRGAMGVVYEAVQKQLNRRVALKVIQVNPDDQIQIARFCREANTAARLNHPNIVSVFDSGEAEGLAYYAMQLIEGRTLQQILTGLRSHAESTNSFAETKIDGDCKKDYSRIDAVERKTNTEGTNKDFPKGQRSNPRLLKDEPQYAYALTSSRAAKHILQVAEALAYAHSEGVLHRDIKPSNIIVDDHGRAWITDFGLAWHADAESLTAKGDIVGTVRYLAPEGFSGRSSEQSDVYSLGLTLFELIEGQPAFSRTDRAPLIREILEGKVPQLTVDAPADLATICGKCIHKDVRDRYASADLLAADLRNFIYGRPIAGRRLSPMQKAVRWCGHNRGVTVLAALLAVVGSCAVAASLFSNRNAERLRAESEASSERARTNLRMLLKTVDRFCQTVSEDRRFYSPEFKDLRELLLESAADLNNQFAANPAVSHEATLQLAGIFHRLGRLGSARETLVECESYLIKARNLLLALPKDEQEQHDVAMELLGCYQELGRVYARMNEAELAKKILQDSISIADQILLRNEEKDDEIDFTARMEKATSLFVLGKVFLDLREFDPAETSVNESIHLIQDVARNRPDNPEVSLELANQLSFLGHLRMSNLRKWKRAEEPFHEAARLYETRRNADVRRPDVDYNYAVLLQRSAKWQFMAQQLPKAIETQQQATNILKNLADRFDHDLAFQLEFGIALRQLADFLQVKDILDPQITPAIEHSVAVLTRAVENDPTDVPRIMALAQSCQMHAEALQKREHFNEALTSIERSILTLNLILDDDPMNALANESRYFAAVTKAELLTDLVRYEESLKEWDLALQLAVDSFVDLTAMKRTRTQALSGDFIQATMRAEEILVQKSTDNQPSRHIVSGAARTFAVAATLNDLTTVSQDDAEKSEHYARRAVELLTSYLDLRGSERNFVSSCEDFDILRNRGDFSAVMQPSATSTP